MVCAASRERFPFDVQHRNIVTYRTDSPSDFEDLSGRITKRLRAIAEKVATLSTAVSAVSSPIASVQGLKPHELVALVAIAQNLDSPDDTVGVYVVRKDMERAGFTKVAVTLALVSLLSKSFISSEKAYDDQSDRSYTVYKLERPGMTWLDENQHQLTLTDDPLTDEPPF